MMGSNDGIDNAKPIHKVTVSNFSIGKYEVTLAQWKAVMGSYPSSHKNCPNCPVETVSWNDIQVYLSKLNKMTGKHYRLPTEAEWEFTAKGGNKSKGYIYAGSNNANEVAWYEDNSNTETHPIGQKKPNELGLYDMSGNAKEWCEDMITYGKAISDTTLIPNQPTRGGDFFWGGKNELRVKKRDYSNVSNPSVIFGFRVALVE